MVAPIDLVGQKFGRLTVVERHFERKGYLSSHWVCTCECGNTAIVRTNNLKSGAIKSCGCLAKELGRGLTHGLSDTAEYRAWCGIKARCYNENNSVYPYYGGRGIGMSDEWRDSFETFYHDMGPKPSPQHSVEHKENDKGYSKENCCWATDKEQSSNRRSNVLYELGGETKTLKEWCDSLGLNYVTIHSRIRTGWTFEDAISEPVRILKRKES